MEDARFFVGAARILAAYDERVAPITELVAAGNEESGSLVVGLTAAGRAVVPGAVDYLIWQEGMGSGALDAYKDRELWLLGRISPRARAELEARGWKIETLVIEG